MRAWLKQRLIPLFDKLFDTFFLPWYHKRLRRRHAPISHKAWMDVARITPFIEGKRQPVHPFQQSYVLQKPGPDTTVDALDGFARMPESFVRPMLYESSEHYLEWARGFVARMMDVVRADGGDLPPTAKILDWGCYAGAMMRSFAPHTDDGEVWGVDLNGEPITWAMLHLAPPFRFVYNTSSGHLPFEDRYFDFVYAGSVMSHIETPDIWLAEIARIMRPGGRFFVTIVDKEAMREYIEKWPKLGFTQDLQRMMTSEEINSDFAQLVLRRSLDQHAVYDREFFLNKCRASFDVLSVTDSMYSYQTGVTLRRKGSNESDVVVRSRGTSTTRMD